MESSVSQQERRHHFVYNPSSACKRNPHVTCQMNPKMKSVFIFLQAVCSSAAGVQSPGVWFTLSFPALELRAASGLYENEYEDDLGLDSSSANLSTSIQTNWSTEHQQRKIKMTLCLQRSALTMCLSSHRPSESLKQYVFFTNFVK